MSKIVEIENLSKKYLIYHEKRGAYITLVDTLTKKMKNLLGKAKNIFSNEKSSPSSYEELWAIRDLNLIIEEGDRVGIIGRNGAGKSTLLKILSRITEPTTGKISIKGRVASLLEVGTGFHPELTGRENIFLNGAILGMSYQEIKRKFDEIVAFSEVEKFLDSPVKQFSSGMYTRLGFAIAAHLDPDLLIVDEALAIGDVKFQEKCLKKLNDLSTYGRTVLFVSHDIGSVMALCNKGIYLEKGILRNYGPIEDCLNAYLKNLRLQSLNWEGLEGDEHVKFKRVVLKGTLDKREYFYQKEIAFVHIEYEILKSVGNVFLGISVWNQRNQLLANSNMAIPPSSAGQKESVFELNTQLFHEGEYIIKIDCNLQNKKKIITDQIALKLIIYPDQYQSNIIQNSHKEGLFLGNGWKHS